MNIPDCPYRPLHDSIIVLPDEAQKKTKAGVELPEELRPPVKTGVVIAVGPGATHVSGRPVPMVVKVGQRVAFGQFAGRSELPLDPEDSTVNPNKQKVKVMAQGEVLGILEPEAHDPVEAIQEAMRWLGLEQEMLVLLEAAQSPAALVDGLTNVIGRKLKSVIDPE